MLVVSNTTNKIIGINRGGKSKRDYFYIFNMLWDWEDQLITRPNF